MANGFNLRIYNRAGHGAQAEGDEDGELDLHFEPGDSLDGERLYVNKMVMNVYASNRPTGGRGAFIVCNSLTNMLVS